MRLPHSNNFDIWWDCVPGILGCHLTRETIGPLVDNAIAYLQKTHQLDRKTGLLQTYHQNFCARKILACAGR